MIYLDLVSGNVHEVKYQEGSQKRGEVEKLRRVKGPSSDRALYTNTNHVSFPSASPALGFPEV